MNIKEAAVQIGNAVKTYFACDEDGEPLIPRYAQRPLFLVGPPGIGKTAIMEQVVAQAGVGLVSYSITHHTRQSALGLPHIVHKTYGDLECDISAYTMSEIIASVYDLMEQTGVKKGILFLDEINCVSETLAPIMLQFLQYKVFGMHPVPEGWVVVTAGNPPEYNHSVREFDVATLDRVRRLEVEPDYDVWKEYAVQANVHPAILTYLEVHKSDFYRVETTVDGKSFVTARGWEDLSRTIRVSERVGLTVDLSVVSQYVQNERVAREFSQYYDLFRKYCSDYQVDKILDGTAPQTIKTRARKAAFDERLALAGLLLDAVGGDISGVMIQYDAVNLLKDQAKKYRMAITKGCTDLRGAYGTLVSAKHDELSRGAKSGALSDRQQRVLRRLLRLMEHQSELLIGASDPRKAYAAVQEDVNSLVDKCNRQADAVKKRLGNMYNFVELVWDGENEVLVITTELTARRDCAAFITQYGCPEYFRHNKDLLLYERQGDLQARLEKLDLN